MSVYLLKLCSEHLRPRRLVFPKRLSTQVAQKEETSSENESLKVFEKLSSIYQKKYEKKPQKPPFVKNLFVGEVDTDLLAYPEAIDKEELIKLENALLPVDFHFSQESEGVGLTKSVIDKLASMKLFGLQAPQLEGGSELKISEVLRYYESMGKQYNNIGAVHHESCGVNNLLKLGNENQLKKYLPDLISGKSICTLCTPDNKMSNMEVQMQATFDANKNVWILNGHRTKVINGSNADLFIVFAETEDKVRKGTKHVTAFIVDKLFGGITSKPVECHGLKETDIADVTFENTHIPAENVLGKVDRGEKMLAGILSEMWLSSGSYSIAQTKALLNKFIQHCKDISTKSENLATSEIVKKKVAEITCSLYAMESMTYMTGALMDQYEDQDCDLEAAIVKAYCAKYTHEAALSCLSLIGSPGFEEGHWCNEIYRNSLSNLILVEPMDHLKLVIALQGLQHAGIIIQEQVSKIRNPFYHATANLIRMWTKRKDHEDRPSLNLKLKEYFHPSLMNQANILEYSILRLQYVTEVLLADEGMEVVTKHVNLMRLADCILEIYAMVASLARVSRSYCIGLTNAEHEILLTESICMNAVLKVKANVTAIDIGYLSNSDAGHFAVAQRTMDIGHYFPEHPMAKNY